MAGAIPWEAILQVGGMSGVAFIPLWVIVQDRGESAKTIKAISITMVTFQQLLIITSLRRRDGAETESDECKRCHEACEEIKRAVESQRAELERIYAK